LHFANCCTRSHPAECPSMHTNCIDMEWTDVIYVKWFCFEVKWSETRGEVLRDKITMYIRVNVYSGYFVVLWPFHLVCVLYYGCFNLLCNVWVFLMCVCVCLLVIFILVLTVLLYCFVYVDLFLFFLCISFRISATEWQLTAVSN